MPKVKDETGKRYGRWTVLHHHYTGTKGARWICRCECGEEKSVNGSTLRSGGSKSCGCLRREVKSGSGAPGWTGGRSYDGAGYVVLWDSKNPNTNKSGYVREHVAVMAEHISRPLRKGETVHHRNGVKDDNRIENLELWVSSHPPGQRVSDKVTWAKEILSTYEPDALEWSEPGWFPDPDFMRGPVWQRPFQTYSSMRFV